MEVIESLSTEEAALEQAMRADSGPAAPQETQPPQETQAPTQAPVTTAAPVGTGAPVTTGAPAGTAAPGETTPAPADAKVVPLTALHEAREEAKQAKAGQVQLQEQLNTLVGRFNDLLALKTTGEPPKKPENQIEIPPIDQNPIGHFQAQIHLLTQGLNQLVGKIQGAEKQQTEAQKQQAEVRDLVNWAGQEERNYMAANPDYIDSLNHLRDVRVNQLKELGVTDENVMLATLQQEILAIAHQAKQQGRSPAAIIHTLSKTMGFVPKVAPAGVTSASVASTPAQAALPAPPAGETDEQRIARLARGHEQAAGLGARGGTAPTGMTAEKALLLSDAEYSALLDTPEGRALLGV